MNTTASEQEGTANEDAIRAWDGPLYERFVRFRDIVTTGLGAHGEEALRLHPPGPGAKVLDVGCGFGDTTQRIAGLVGPAGEVVGVDAAPRFIQDAICEARDASVANVRFLVADVQVGLGGEKRFDMAFSRFGTMFFASPVAALRNVRAALVPGGKLVMVVWRRRIDNDWLYRAQTIVEGIVARPEEYDEPTCGPGPFSMADADTTSDILTHAGFSDITLHRYDLPIVIGTLSKPLKWSWRSAPAARSCAWPAIAPLTCMGRSRPPCAKDSLSSPQRETYARPPRPGSSPPAHPTRAHAASQSKQARARARASAPGGSDR